MQGLKIAIIGCGIGGLASALFLTRQGHAVTLFERFERPSPVGSGLVIQPVGQDVLAEIGCLDAVQSKGARIYSMLGIESGTRRSVLQVGYGPEGGETFGVAASKSYASRRFIPASMAASTSGVGARLNQ